MMLFSFGIGMWYFDFKSIIDTILVLGTIVVLYKNPKNSIYSLLIAIVLAFVFRMIL